MVRTTENLKISIMLVLSITILAAILVTGTVVNIVSAANSINVQTKTNQHPVTSTGSPHIVPSAGGSINIQTKTNQHPVTSTGSPHIVRSSYKPIIVYVCPAGGSVKVPPKYRIVCSHTVSSAAHLSLGQCYVVNVIDGDGAAPVPSPSDRDCPADIRDMYLHPSPDGYKFDFGGRLVGCEGQMGESNIPFTGDKCYGWVNLDKAPIEIKVMMGKDVSHAHGWYTPGVVTKTAADGTFAGTFPLCDDPKYTDHSAYLTAYFSGGEVSGSKYPGPDVQGTSSTGRGDMWFTLHVCGKSAHFTDMHITSNPHDNFMYSGKLVGEGNLSLDKAWVFLTARYLDDTPTHPHVFDWDGAKPLVITNADGTFTGSFVSCDRIAGSGYRSDAQFNAQFNGMTVSGKIPYMPATSEKVAFTTMPCASLGQHTPLSPSAAHK